ncbi:unnamed protein product, partial [Effrenium voratum]
PMLLLLAFVSANAETNPTGLATCPCIEWANLNLYKVDNVVKFSPPNDRLTYDDYPANYGNLECKAHDENLAPFCKGSSPPAWCTQNGATWTPPTARAWCPTRACCLPIRTCTTATTPVVSPMSSRPGRGRRPLAAPVPA